MQRRTGIFGFDELRVEDGITVFDMLVVGLLVGELGVEMVVGRRLYDCVVSIVVGNHSEGVMIKERAGKWSQSDLGEKGVLGEPRRTTIYCRGWKNSKTLIDRHSAMTNNTIERSDAASGRAGGAMLRLHSRDMSISYKPNPHIPIRFR